MEPFSLHGLRHFCWVDIIEGTRDVKEHHQCELSPEDGRFDFVYQREQSCFRRVILSKSVLVPMEQFWLQLDCVPVYKTFERLEEVVGQADGSEGFDHSVVLKKSC